jgi:fatty-acyl-CoA synthase
VGKIFKPKLRWDATQRAYEEELKALGDMLEDVAVRVGEDKVHGTRVDISVKPQAGVDFTDVKEKIAAILTRYTLYYEVHPMEG